MIPSLSSLHPTRREFVSRTAAGAVALAVSPALRAAPARPEFDVGFSLYGMKTLPLAEAVATCARIGYRNVELTLDAGYPTEPSKFDAAARTELRRQLQQLGLTVSGLMLNLNLADSKLHANNLAAIKTAAQLAHDVQPSAPPPIETVTRGRPAEWEALKAGMVERAHAWGDAAAAGRVRIVIKSHVSGAVHLPGQLRWLLEQAGRPALRAAYDYSHYEARGLPTAETWRTLASLTDFVHVKDNVGDAQKPKFVLPGEGRTDYGALFRVFRSTGYRGPVVVEVSSQVFNVPGYDPVRAAEKSYAALTKGVAASR